MADCAVRIAGDVVGATAGDAAASTKPGRGKGGDKGASIALSAGAALLYACSSVALTLLNKTLFAQYKFKLLYVLAAGQSLFTLLVRHAAVASAILPPPDMSGIAEAVPMAAAFLLMVLTTFAAQDGTNLVMFGTLRRTNVLFVLVGQFVFLRMSTSRPKVVTTLVVVGGALMASMHDAEFDARAYGFAFMANVTTTAYLLLAKRHKNKSSLDILYHNSMLSLPVFLLAAAHAGETRAMMQHPYVLDPGFQATLSLSITLGCVISFAVMLNTKVNSPLTQTVTGMAKGAVVLVVGVFLFRSKKPSPENLVGAGTGLLGSMAYAWFGYRERLSQAQKP